MSTFPQPERYTVFLNPYPEFRFEQCPRCGERTYERNRVFIVQLAAGIIVPAMVTCRYCVPCDLLIVHQDELAEAIRGLLGPEEEDLVGDEFVIFATIDRGRLPGGGIEGITQEDALSAFCPIRGLVHFEVVQDKTGRVQFREVELPYPQIAPADEPAPMPEEVEPLPQVNEIWQMGVTLLGILLSDQDDNLIQPYLMLVIDPTGPFILYQDLQEQEPTEEDVRKAILKAMARPLLGSGQPRRPTAIVTREERWRQALEPLLKTLDIEIYVDDTPELDQVLQEVEQFFGPEEPPIPGLLEDPRVTPEQVRELFEAAAEFYEEAPWEVMLDEDLVAIRYPSSVGRWRFASVMGYAGMEYGLAVFDDIDDYELLAMGSPEETIGLMDYHTLTFNDVSYVPPADLEAIQRYGWPVVDEDGYPVPVIFTRNEELLRPGPEELDWYIVAMRALVRFVQDFWPDEIDYVPHPVSVTYRVPLRGRQVEVDLRYPAELAFEPDERE